MVALPLIEAVIASNNSSRALDVAAQLVNAAILDLGQIEALDDSLAPSDPTQFDRQNATLIRNLYEQWARETDALLGRLAQVERRFGKVTSSQTLRDAHGRTLAMLSISIDDMEAARRDVAQGRLMSLEEVRRELRLEVH